MVWDPYIVTLHLKVMFLRSEAAAWRRYSGLFQRVSVLKDVCLGHVRPDREIIANQVFTHWKHWNDQIRCLIKYQDVYQKVDKCTLYILWSQWGGSEQSLFLHSYTPQPLRYIDCAFINNWINCHFSLKYISLCCLRLMNGGVWRSLSVRCSWNVQYKCISAVLRVNASYKVGLKMCIT